MEENRQPINYDRLEFSRLIGNAGKYGGLMLGVYSMAQDSPSIAGAFAGGMIYLIGTIVSDNGTATNRIHEKVSNIEKKLEEGSGQPTSGGRETIPFP